MIDGDMYADDPDVLMVRMNDVVKAILCISSSL